MPTFIDESGCIGHDRASKPYFRLASVRVSTLAEAESFRHAVRQLRVDLRLSSSFEFKFSATSGRPEVCRGFFTLARDTPFVFASCHIGKVGYWSRASGHEQHWATATTLAVCLRKSLRDDERPTGPLADPVLVDRNNDPRFLDRVDDAFRGLKSNLHPDYPMTANARFRDSHSDEMLQLADMVCGAVGASFEGNGEWLELISSHQRGIVRLP